MNQYEAIIIVNAGLTDEEATEKLEKYKTMLGGVGGEILHESTWGRRKLAYEIQKCRHGIYFLWYIKAEGGSFINLEKEMGYDDQILKWFVSKVDDLEIAHTRFENLKATPKMTIDLLSNDDGGL